MMGNEDAAARPDIAKALDDLALRVMVDGARALTSESLGGFSALAEQVGATSLAAEAKAGLQQSATQILNNGDAQALIHRLQALLPTVSHNATQPAASAVTLPPSSLPAPAPTLVFEEDPEMLAGFVMEATEHLAAIEEKILLLERDPSLIDAVHAVFRAFHTIKGLAGFLGLSGVQAVAHEVETLLDYARKGKISITPETVDLVLESSEYLKEEVAHVDARINNTALPSIRDNIALLATLSVATGAAAEGKTIPRRVPTTALSPAPIVPAQSLPSPLPLPAEAQVVPKQAAEAEPRPSPAPTLSPAPDPLAVAATPPSTQKARVDTSTQSVRVETAKLDRLMDMVGEMVIAQSILTNHPRWKVHQDARLAGDMSRLVRITGEVQKCAMSMRMMPIGPLFQKNAKMVRDLSRRNGKQVNLILCGESTELDKTIAEELSDPLLHMIRNALDHGIETPQERTAAGKNPEATLRISAEHEAGQIVISIADDGRGLDTQRIFAKAVQNGLVNAHDTMTHDEIFHLIFEPGFSTAEKITDISGRGVGMDVVRKHVETLRGRIDIRSELGKGTTFFIRVPLTLAIIEGLVVVVGKHRYIIPVFSVREMFQPTQEMLFTVQGKEEMILMRGELLPVVRLYRRFDIEPRTENVCQGLMVVCQFSGKQFCLFVDDLSGRQEIVIKSLDETFKNTKGLAGCAILGDGRIGLILDVKGIFQGLAETNEKAAA